MTANTSPIPSLYLEPNSIQYLAEAHNAAKNWADSWDCKTSALHIGPTECGKSTFLAHIVSKVGAWDIRHQKNGLRIGMVQPENSDIRDIVVTRWIRADELSRLLCDKSTAQEVTLVKTCPILVVDDLGYERFPELILEVIGARYDFHRPTLVTSGEKVDALVKRYGQATLRKIAKSNGASLVDCWVDATRRTSANRQAVAPPVARHGAQASVTGPGPVETRQVGNPEALKAIREKLKRIGLEH